MTKKIAAILATIMMALGLVAITGQPAQAATECVELHAPGDQEICFLTVDLFANGDVRLRVEFRGANKSWIESDPNAGYDGDFKVPYKYGTHDIWGSTIPKSGETSAILCCARPSHLNYSVTVRLNNYPDDRVSGQMPWG